MTTMTKPLVDDVQLLKKAGEYLPPDKVALVAKAYEFAAKAHEGQKRESGEPFISHPLAVAMLLAELGLIAPNDPRFVSTVEVIGRELRRDFNVMRYVAADDFGLPETAFLICRFWLIDAMWETGQRDEAREMFVDALGLRNRYGLLSEDVHPVTGKLWGNFPQTYSMSGLILTSRTNLARSSKRHSL